MAVVTSTVAGTEVLGSAVIDGTPCDGTAGVTHEVLDPATGAVVADLPLAGPADVNRAVAAASAAFAGWSGATPGERSGAMQRLAEIMTARAEEYAQVETAQTGTRTCLKVRPR
jgi:betaine-aldehyde dehydrogenase